jgi:hypothetical protein
MNTFGLKPEKSKPKRDRKRIAFQIRNGIDAPWSGVRNQSVTQDAEGNLAVPEFAEWRLHGAVGPVFYPRRLWRLA